MLSPVAFLGVKKVKCGQLTSSLGIPKLVIAHLNTMSQCHNAWPKQCGDAPVMNCLTKAENPAAREQSSEFCLDLVDDSHVNKTQLHSSQN